MNRYRHRFTTKCPNNSGQIAYTLVIWSPHMIMVENIAEACAGFERAYHEDMADKLALQFGGRQVLSAEHHGVQIVTTRGPLFV